MPPKKRKRNVSLAVPSDVSPSVSACVSACVSHGSSPEVISPIEASFAITGPKPEQLVDHSKPFIPGPYDVDLAMWCAMPSQCSHTFGFCLRALKHEHQFVVLMRDLNAAVHRLAWCVSVLRDELRLRSEQATSKHDVLEQCLQHCLARQKHNESWSHYEKLCRVLTWYGAAHGVTLVTLVSSDSLAEVSSSSLDTLQCRLRLLLYQQSLLFCIVQDQAKKLEFSLSLSSDVTTVH